MLSKVENQEAPNPLLSPETEQASQESTLVERAVAMVRELNRKYPPTGLLADKAFIDSLYED